HGKHLVLATKDALKSPVRENRTPGSVRGRQLLEKEADLSTRQSRDPDQKQGFRGQDGEKSKTFFGKLAILTLCAVQRERAAPWPSPRPQRRPCPAVCRPRQPPPGWQSSAEFTKIDK
ncbi:MAG: hypothetical protein QM270_00005, partial [Bacillota bacterium]|nr:hypothetical protein [Bacillota bacterium]